MDSPRDQHCEHRVAPCHRALDDVSVISCSGNDSDAAGEPVELFRTLLTAHANYLVASIQRVLHHVLPELSRCSDDANLHDSSPPFIGLTETNVMPKSRTVLAI